MAPWDPPLDPPLVHIYTITFLAKFSLFYTDHVKIITETKHLCSHIVMLLLNLTHTGRTSYFYLSCAVNDPYLLVTFQRHIILETEIASVFLAC